MDQGGETAKKWHTIKVKKLLVQIYKLSHTVLTVLAIMVYEP